MSNHIDKVAAGQPWKPPRAALVNNTVDAINAVLAKPGRFDSSTGYALPIVEAMVKSAARKAAGAVVGFGDPLNTTIDATEAQHPVIFSEAAPVAGRWGVARKGIDPGLIGPVVLVGVAWAQVNITDEAHEFAEIALGVLNSDADSGYAKILYKPAGLGVNWCCLQLGTGTAGTSSPANLTCENIRAEFGYNAAHPTNHGIGTWALVVKNDACQLMEVLVC